MSENEKAKPTKSNDNQGPNASVPVAVAAGAGAVGGAVVAPAILVASVNAAGFTSAGVAAGSFAASVQGASVASGSLFAAAQSIGATGTLGYLGVGSLAVVGAGALLGASVVGGAGYMIYQSVSKKNELNAKPTGNQAAHDLASCEDRAPTVTASKKQLFTRENEGDHNTTVSPSELFSSSSSSSQIQLVKLADSGNLAKFVSGFSSCFFHVGMNALQLLECGQLYRVVLAPESRQTLLSAECYLAYLKSNSDVINGLVMNNKDRETAAGIQRVSSFARMILQGTSLALGQYQLYQLHASLDSIHTMLEELLDHTEMSKLAQLSSCYEELRAIVKEKDREHDYIKEQAFKLRPSIWELLCFFRYQLASNTKILRSKEAVKEEELIKFRRSYERFHFAWRLYQCLMCILAVGDEEDEIKTKNEQILQAVGEFLGAYKNVKKEKAWFSQLLPKSVKEEKEAQDFQEWIERTEHCLELTTCLRSIDLYVRVIKARGSEEKLMVYARVNAV